VRRRLACAAVLAGLLAVAPAAHAHQGNPDYRSTVTGVTPRVEGLDVSVLNYDDRLLVHDTSGRTVVIEDYEGRPYARVLADRTVEVNTSSSAYYLNQDRTGATQAPAGLPAAPHWKLLSRTGRFEWHDHRIHWMGSKDPPQLKDRSRRTRIFDWKVPIRVGATEGAIAGTLDWVPQARESLPMAAILAFAALVIVLCVAVVVVRRRRAGDPEPVEAW
jgi:hypothetical protein